MAPGNRQIGEQVIAIADEIAHYAGSSARGANTIHTCVTALESSIWPEVAWRFSGLNQDGCPVEFAFSSRDNALRYTTEVAGPELGMHERLATACELIDKLQPGARLAEPLDSWHTIQSGAALRWGCWLGVREDGAGQRLKLYLEVSKCKASEQCSIEPVVQGSELLMIGHDLSSGRHEYYFRQPQLSAWEADAFQRSVENTKQGGALLGAFADLCGMPAASALRWAPFGYSVSCDSGSGTRQFTLFVRSSSLGKMGRTRRQFVAYEASLKRESCYQALLGELADFELPEHGMLSFSTCEPEIEMRVSLSALALNRVRMRRAEVSSACG